MPDVRRERAAFVPGCGVMAALILCLVAAPARSEQAGHPVPWEFASDRYGVTVNDKPVTVFLAAMNVHFASFDLTGPAEVQVTINKDDYNRADGRRTISPEEFWQGKAEVRPLSRGIKPKTDGRVVTFAIEKPGQYSVERPGTGGFEDEVLLLFANPPQKDLPKRDDPKVIWLEAGTHQRSVDLASGQTLYLAPGAVLFGGINVWDAEDVRICGRGTVVYYGPQSTNVDSGWVHRKNWHPLTAHNVKGLKVEGVNFVGRSRVWTIQLYKTFDVAFDNIKIITTFPSNLNGDGIDWYGGGRATVRDSFFRVADDCFAFHPADASESLRWDRGGGGHLPGGPKAIPKAVGDVRDITIERCVFWPTIANVVRAGWSNQSLTTQNVTLRDCDVIHIAAHEWMGASDALFTTLTPDGKGECHHSDYLFDNIRFDDPGALLSVNWPEGKLRNFRFKDIHFNAGVRKSFLRAAADGLDMTNVMVKRQPAAGAPDLNLTIEGDVKNLRFTPGGK